MGKYLKGSGLDTVAVETGIYSAAALHGIYTGKAVKRGVAYHLMNVTDFYDDLASQYADQIEPKVAGMDAGELAQFLTNYMKQVQCLLHIISVCRQGDLEAYLAALDDQIQYL